AGSARTSIEPEEDQHLGTANVVVDVAPVRIAHIRETVGAPTVGAVGEPNARRAVRRRKLEWTLGIVARQKCLNLLPRESSPERLRAGFFEKAAVWWRWIGHSDPGIGNGCAD